MVTQCINSVLNTIIIDPLVVFILAIMLGILGLILTVIFRDKLDADNKSKSWPSVPGKITSSRIEKRSNYSYSTRGRNTRYAPVIKYSYNVDGNPYYAE